METDKIYLGDANKLIKDIQDKSIDLIVTDPPYEIYGLHAAGICKDRHYLKQLQDGKLGSSFDMSILNEFVRVMKKINLYIWCNKEQIYDYLTFFVKERGCNFETIIWAKDNPPPFLNGHYLKDKEYCLYFWEQGVKVHPRFSTGKTVYVTPLNMEDKKKYAHPTIKPLNIVENMVENSSNEDELVLDPFSGSGTSCVAAKELGRHYIGFEIEPKWWKVSVDRLNGATKKEMDAGFVQERLF